MPKTTVVHVGDGYDIYIGRRVRTLGYLQSRWANPFKIGRDGTRRQVIEKFRAYAAATFSSAELAQLRGKRLGCWCKPKYACHGDVLVEMIEILEAGDG